MLFVHLPLRRNHLLQNNFYIPNLSPIPAVWIHPTIHVPSRMPLSSGSSPPFPLTAVSAPAREDRLNSCFILHGFCYRVQTFPCFRLDQQVVYQRKLKSTSSGAAAPTVRSRVGEAKYIKYLDEIALLLRTSYIKWLVVRDK